MRVIHRVTLAAAASVAVSAIVAAGVVASPLAQAQPASFVGGFSTVTTIASTVPANIGDVNPYGVAVVRHSEGKLVRGDVLVSNFNNSANQQGTGTTIVSISPRGRRACSPGSAPRGCPARAPAGSASPPRCPS